MIKYQPETVAECIDDIMPLNLLHWKEVATHKEQKQLDPDYDAYYAMEAAKMLRIYTARDDGELIGYFISIITPHIHYQSMITALNDILYLLPKYRGSITACKLFVNAIHDLKNNTDTSRVIIHMKLEHPFRPLLKRLGFEQTEENWEKAI